jgi:signal recognition particle subunit SRP68
MAEHLEAWESFAPAAGKPAAICRLPPPMQPVPFRPIMLDTASNCIAYPSLEVRLKRQAGKTGLRSWLGW